jgi:hypothetical protein
MSCPEHGFAGATTRKCGPGGGRVAPFAISYAAMGPRGVQVTGGRGWSVLGLLLAASVAGCDSGPDGRHYGTLACPLFEQDAWRVPVEAPGDLSVEVDTVAFETAFDPAVVVVEVVAWSDIPAEIVVGDELAFDDGALECTYPPPAFDCARVTAEVSKDVLVLVENLGHCRGPVGEYEMRLALDGRPIMAEYLGLFDYY